MAIEHNPQWDAFINEYRNLRELWDVKNEKYKNKKLKAKSYEKLAEVYKSVDPTSTVEKVKKRIKNMRSAYNRELKKKIASEKNGSDEIYEPNLWYFHPFEFLKDIEMYHANGGSSDEESAPKVPVRQARKNKKVLVDDKTERSELLKKAKMHLDNYGPPKERDEADIYGEAWACSYRKLSAEQKLYAKKACDEIFVLGQLGKLNFNSVRTSTSTLRSTESSPVPHILSVSAFSNVHQSPVPSVKREDESIETNESEYSAYGMICNDNSDNTFL